MNADVCNALAYSLASVFTVAVVCVEALKVRSPNVDDFFADLSEGLDDQPKLTESDLDRFIAQRMRLLDSEELKKVMAGISQDEWRVQR